jgi:hypothetical protein
VCRYDRLYQDKREEGFWTSTLTRPQLVGRFGAILVQRPEVFKSERLLLQCRSFVRQPGGQSAASAGEHDDCVMAMAIALAVREERLAGQKFALA